MAGAVVSDAVRRSLLSKSSGNRRFFDAICHLLWCERRAGIVSKSKDWEVWADIELPYFGVSKGAVIDTEIKETFNTPRRVLSVMELDAMQAFIDTHEFSTVIEAQKGISSDLLNDCVACSLNHLAEEYGEAEDMGAEDLKKESEQLMLW